MPDLNDIKLDLANKTETYVTTHLPGLWSAVERHPAVHRVVNAALISRAILKIPTRPNPLSTRADYTSWASLTDRTYDGRHLPPAAPSDSLPDVDVIAGLFNRGDEMVPCPKSTVLFPYFGSGSSTASCAASVRTLTRGPASRPAIPRATSPTTRST